MRLQHLIKLDITNVIVEKLDDNTLELSIPGRELPKEIEEAIGVISDSMEDDILSNALHEQLLKMVYETQKLDFLNSRMS